MTSHAAPLEALRWAPCAMEHMATRQDPGSYRCSCVLGDPKSVCSSAIGGSTECSAAAVPAADYRLLTSTLPVATRVECETDIM